MASETPEHTENVKPRTLLVWNKQTDEVFTAPYPDKSNQYLTWFVDIPCVIVNPNFRLRPIVQKSEIEETAMLQGEVINDG